MPFTDQDIGPLLQGMGYKYIDGYGPTAIWETAPQGQKGTANYVAPQRFPQSVLANSIFGTESPYQPQKVTPQSPADSPDIRYDASGQAFSWDGKAWQPDPRFNDPTKAAGYRAPSQAQPLAPHIQVGQNGDVYRIDPYTGVPSLVGSAPSLAQQPNLQTFTGSDGTLWTMNPQTGQAQSTGIQVAFSKEELRSQQIADQQSGRDFTAQQNASNQAFQAGQQQNQQSFTAAENANQRGFSAQQASAGRGFTANESANDRALRAAEFAAQQEAQQQGLDFQAQQANRAGEADASNRRLAAARQYADLVSSTDTAALPAYLAAGGGVLWNAKANPNAPSLLTDNAINPAASSLRDARTIAWQPIVPKAIQGFQQPAYQQWTEPAYSPGQAAQTAGVASPPSNQPTQTTWMPGSVGAGTNMTPQQAANQPSMTGDNSPGVLGVPAGGNLSVNAQGQAVGFAGGTGNGFIPAPHQGFYAGEQGPEYQQVVDPPGPNNAMIRIVPNPQTVQGFAMGTVPGYAMGTDPTQMGIDPNGLDPYAAEVRQFRQGFKPIQTGFSQFDPRFQRQLGPTIRAAYYNAEQTRTGEPGADLAFEANRFTPRGFSAFQPSLMY